MNVDVFIWAPFRITFSCHFGARQWPMPIFQTYAYLITIVDFYCSLCKQFLLLSIYSLTSVGQEFTGDKGRVTLPYSQSIQYQFAIEPCKIHKDALSVQPALIENDKKLSEKINIVCLMELIFRYGDINSIICASILSAKNLNNLACLISLLCSNVWFLAAIH